MASGNKTNGIDAEAADWAARSDRDLSPAEDAALTAWLAADPRHPGAYARARAAAILLQRTLVLDGQGKSSERSGSPHVSRRHLLWGGSAIAASVAGAVGIGAAWNARQETVFTQRGETRSLPLPDGSVAELNTDTRIRFRFSGGRREVWLDEGEAAFTIVRSSLAPFSVMAGGVEIVSSLSQVVIRNLPARPLQVMVARGVAELKAHGAMPGARLTAPSSALVPADGAPVVTAGLSPRQIDIATLWQAGKIAFEDAALSEVAGEFARYSDVRLIIDDRRLAREQVSGLFDARDPAGFAAAVAPSLGLTVRTRGKDIHLAYK
ncbi:FecR domain-containing protein [Asticcacaulis sp. BYS171W]|uniref:FecR domain-containing protein n=1 Tax=Asticcacaulis aquaticus TaxID=2984212 RepID=A0ABT5HZ41_9CAUL|nr:FecR domain-containing protein [Asticcacaulis aquaticus]